MKARLVLVLDNIRSGHNVGSLMRTCDGLGIDMIYVCGITPYPRTDNDPRPEHVIRSNVKEIRKTALGAEDGVSFVHEDDTSSIVRELKARGYEIYCLENNVPDTERLNEATCGKDAALVLGSEVDGLSSDVLSLADHIIEIPMRGQKNSLNVSVAGAIALYALAQPRD
jgi:23S rRNA (guanosine2251-2'-O)-methyltransferase